MTAVAADVRRWLGTRNRMRISSGLKLPDPPPRKYRVNGHIRAREVRVREYGGVDFGIFALSDAIKLAMTRGIDLIEIDPSVLPPICLLIDYGKFRYGLTKNPNTDPTQW